MMFAVIHKYSTQQCILSCLYRREIDPEEEPDFAERNPLWEDDLPPIRPHDENFLGALALEEDTIKKQIPTVVPTSNYHPKPLSVPHRRWKIAYAAVKKNLVSHKLFSSWDSLIISNAFSLVLE